MMRRLAAVVAGMMLVTLLPSAAVAGEPEVDTELLVVVKVDTRDSLIEIVSELEAEIERPLIESRGVFLVSRTDLIKPSDAEKKSEDLAKDIAKDDRVEWAEAWWEITAEDDRFHAWPDASPTITSSLPGPEQAAFATLGLAEAHTVATGEGVVVAVLDTGVDLSHPLLTGRLLRGYDMIGDDANPSEVADGRDDDDDGLIDEAYGHGTFVAGVVAQIAPDAQILPIRVLDADGVGDLHAVIEGIEFAIEAGADVINLSFGLAEKSKSKALKEVFEAAREAGIVVVAAAGNAGNDDKHYPAADKDTVSVGALDSSGAQLAGFSGRGKWVDVVAPGEDIISALPGGGVATWAGTSMAAPVVSAQLALMIELQPDAEPKDLEKMLWKSCRKPDKWDNSEEGIIDILASLVEASE